MVEKRLQVQLQLTLDTFKLAINFTAPLGLIVLFGPSGAGKSTILDCIAGLRKPDAGLISLANQIFFDSSQGICLSPQKRKLGFVFQRQALFPHLNVRQNIAFGLIEQKVQERNTRLEELLDLFQLGNFAHRYPANLSGGEAQRVALARAIANHPQLLLLDEPFSSLDSKSRSTLRSELLSLKQKLALPMVLVTHSREEALELADVVVSIEKGQ